MVKWQFNHAYKPKLSLPTAIKDVIKPIFVELSADNLLEKCLHGLTQNVNESLNAVIWTRCPKPVFVGREVLLIGVCSAIIAFNDGTYGLKSVFENLKIFPGILFELGADERDSHRISVVNKQSSDNVKKGESNYGLLRRGI